MSLETNVTNRYGGATSEFLIGLTNCFSRTASSIDSAQLTRACDDVKSQMEVYGGAVYDESPVTNPLHYQQHIATACPCVIAKLKQFTGQIAGADEEWERCRQSIISMSKVGARNRFPVQTDSGTTKSTENPNGGVIRPPFDDQMFTPCVPTQTPNAPGPMGGGTYNEDP